MHTILHICTHNDTHGHQKLKGYVDKTNSVYICIHTRNHPHSCSHVCAYVCTTNTYGKKEYTSADVPYSSP